MLYDLKCNPINLINNFSVRIVCLFHVWIEFFSISSPQKLRWKNVKSQNTLSTQLDFKTFRENKKFVCSTWLLWWVEELLTLVRCFVKDNSQFTIVCKQLSTEIWRIKLKKKSSSRILYWENFSFIHIYSENNNFSEAKEDFIMPESNDYKSVGCLIKINKKKARVLNFFSFSSSLCV